jgi:drug/metabolite transporter (DMT)-like permease
VKPNATAFWQGQLGVCLWIVAIAASWGTAFAFIKVITLAGFGPWSTSAGRSGLTVIILAVYLMFARHKFLSDRVAIGQMVVLGVFNGLLPNVLIAFAMKDLATAPAGLIQASVPIFVALGAHFVFMSERLSKVQTLGVLMGFAGAVIVIGPADIMTGKTSWTGSAAMVCAAMCYATSTLFVRAQKPKDILSVTLGAQMVASVGAVVLAAIFENPMKWQVDQWVVLSFFGLSFISTLIPLLLYFKLLKTIAASRAATVQYLLPLFTGLYGFWFLHESLDAKIIFGGVVILAGMAFTNTAKKQN